MTPLRRGAVVIVLGSAVLLPAQSGLAKPAYKSGLVYQGLVTEGAARPLFVDAPRRRLYVKVESDFAEYDLDAPYGKMFLRSQQVAGDFGDSTVAPDLPRRRVFVADRDSALGGEEHSVIRVLDLRTFQLSAGWDINKIIPGFFIQALTYSAEDDRVYVAGTVIGSSSEHTLTFFRAPYYPVTVLALDAANGTLAWMRNLKMCVRPMTYAGDEGHIFRSVRHEALYVLCARPDAYQDATMYPGPAGVLKLTISPIATSVEAASFPEEFYRASGGFFEQVGAVSRAVFDPTTERLSFLSSSRANPGAWVFDGAMSAWVGFVPTTSPKNFTLGADPATGHLYTLDGPRTGILVTDLRATPVPRGQVHQTASQAGLLQAHLAKNIVVDPATRRIFVGVQGISTEGLVDSQHRLVAFKDVTPLAPPEPAAEFDQLTEGVPEGPNTLTNYSATARGFGMRGFLVGGISGLTSPARTGAVGGQVDRELATPGDRGFWVARLTSMDLRNVGASATAQAVVTDDVTRDQLRTLQNDVESGNLTGADPDALQESPVSDRRTEVASALEWRWSPASCLDPGGEPAREDPSGPAGRATVECDLSQERAVAESRASAFGADHLSVGTIAVGSARFKATANRRIGEGASLGTLAVVDNLSIEIPGVGELRIAEIRNAVTTAAAGMDGTADVAARATISGARILDASGAVVYACEECDARVLARHVNDEFSHLMRIRVPKPDVIETKGGAFAAYREQMADYINDLVMNNDSSAAVPALHVEIYNDWAEKSRLVLQFAAIESSALYGVTSLPTAGDPPPIPLLPPVLGPFGGDTPDAGVIVETTAPPAQGLVPRIIEAAMFLARSPGDLASMLTLWLLLGCVGGLCARRSTLSKSLSSR
ncbi:MAG TPA: hypothetical protein VGB83_05030 [Actinomycetota bacterium]